MTKLQVLNATLTLATTVSAVIMALLMNSFRAGSKYRDFERAGRLISDLATDVQALPEKCRQQMVAELDRHYDRVLTPQLQDLRRDIEHIMGIIERRHDGDRRHGN